VAIMPNFRQIYDGIAVAYLGRGLARRDGLSEAVIARAEKLLGVRLPEALREYYACAGNASGLNEAHNHFRNPRDLYFEGEYLMFMDENQAVVSWGIKRADLGEADPVVWQRNNTPPEEWYSEEKSFTELMASMFEWYKSEGI